MSFSQSQYTVDGSSTIRTDDHTKVPLDDYDAATAKLTQLHALLVSVTSDGFEAFEGMAPALRHDLLWLARDLAEDACRRLNSTSRADRATVWPTVAAC